MCGQIEHCVYYTARRALAQVAAASTNRTRNATSLALLVAASPSQACKEAGLNGMHVVVTAMARIETESDVPMDSTLPH
eukprot:6199551-Pleurochrysis_carterae.AAC.1